MLTMLSYHKSLLLPKTRVTTLLIRCSGTALRGSCCGRDLITCCRIPKCKWSHCIMQQPEIYSSAELTADLIKLTQDDFTKVYRTVCNVPPAN